MRVEHFVLRTLGGLSLENGGRPITGAAGQRGRLALLAAIATAGDRGISRDRLLALFWAESDTERARGALKQALYSLRRDVGERDLTLGTSELRLNPEVIQSDIGEFEEAIKQRQPQRAIELYQGPFLDGIHLHDSPEFERWAEQERDRLVAAYRGALAGLARTAAGSDDDAAAVEWWRKLAAADPLSSSVAVSLMEALIATGDRAAALRHARVYTTLVREELDAAPDPAVSALADRIRATTAVPPASGNGVDRPAGERKRRVDSAVQAAAVLHPVPLPAPAASRRRSLLIGVAVTTALVLVGGAVMAVWGASHRPLDPHRVVVTSASTFAATAPNDALDALLHERLAAGIIETHLATVAPVSKAVLQRGAPPGSPLTIEQTRAIGDAAGARYIVHATYQMDGDVVLLGAQVTDAETGTLLGPIEPAQGDRSAPQPAIDMLRSRVMAALAARLDPKLESWSHAAAMPTTYESYRELRLGIDAFIRWDLPSARGHFGTSAALDTTSATPLVWTAYTFAYAPDQVESTIIALEGSRRRFGPWDRALLEVVKAWAAGNLPAAHAAGHRLLAVVPNSEWAYVVAFDAFSLGRAREAVRLLRQMDPDRRWMGGGGYWVYLQHSYHLLGDYQSELAAVRKALQREPENRGFFQNEIRALAALGRVREVEDRCIGAKDVGPGPHEMVECLQAAVELRAHGHPEAALRLVQLEIASRRGVPESTQMELPFTAADMHFLIGNFAEAERLFRESTPQQKDLKYLILAAKLAAVRGDRAEVKQFLEQLGHPLHVPSGEASLGAKPTIILRAELAALLGDRDEAVNWLTQAFRNGARSRTMLHWNAAFYPLHGYPPFEALICPVDDDEKIPPE